MFIQNLRLQVFFFHSSFLPRSQCCTFVRIYVHTYVYNLTFVSLLMIIRSKHKMNGDKNKTMLRQTINRSMCNEWNIFVDIYLHHLHGSTRMINETKKQNNYFLYTQYTESIKDECKIINTNNDVNFSRLTKVSFFVEGLLLNCWDVLQIRCYYNLASTWYYDDRLSMCDNLKFIG